MELANLRQFIGTVTTILLEIQYETDNIRQNRDRSEFYANRVLAALRHTYNISIFLERSGDFQESREITQLNDQLKDIYQQMYSFPGMSDYSYRPPVQHTGARGRPRFVITREQLQFLRSEFNSWADIARDIGVSRQTIFNRRRELVFSLEFEHYTEIDDAQLDAVVQEELNAFPRTGETNVVAGLRGRKIFLFSDGE